MKKILISLLFLLSFTPFLIAQIATAPVKSTGLTKEGKPDMRLKANKQVKVDTKVEKTTQTTTVKSAGTNKDGSPDMRMKANKVPKTQVAPAPAPTVSTTTTVPVTKTTTTRVSNTTTSSTDKVFGTDAKGRTIYEGPRGGHYYITAKGNKEYIKK